MKRDRRCSTRLHSLRNIRRVENNPWVLGINKPPYTRRKLRARLRQLEDSYDVHSQEPEELLTDVATTSISMPDQSPPSRPPYTRQKLRARLRQLEESYGVDSQEPEELLSDVATTSISMPDQSPPSRLASQSAGIKKELGSKASLRVCSARMEENPSDDNLKGSDQYQEATPDSVKFATQEELSSHVTTTSMLDQVTVIRRQKLTQPQSASSLLCSFSLFLLNFRNPFGGWATSHGNHQGKAGKLANFLFLLPERIFLGESLLASVLAWDFDGVAGSCWVPIGDQVVVLMAGIFLAYMAGVIPVQNELQNLLVGKLLDASKRESTPESRLLKGSRH
ncbi:unnamed protein product [Microthlaspi erraticum]|uniref:Uncharacterized protein n=1 Tax=Microthlaspi erraticum TaxID=1685480 RepID=A0A6D2ILA5_9BRAS|nr:unnamed protein product [Microthlaspi erraticum]